jgi:hypothetical protein
MTQSPATERTEPTETFRPASVPSVGSVARSF